MLQKSVRLADVSHVTVREIVLSSSDFRTQLVVVVVLDVVIVDVEVDSVEVDVIVDVVVEVDSVEVDVIVDVVVVVKIARLVGSTSADEAR